MPDGNGYIHKACEENIGMEIICPECDDIVICEKNHVCGMKFETKEENWINCKLKNKKKDFKASAKEYYDNLDSKRYVCLKTGKCNPELYRQIYYTFTHQHSKKEYGDCPLRYSALNNLKKLKRNVANYWGIFPEWKQFIKDDKNTFVNDYVFCVTKQHFEDVFNRYGYDKEYIFDKTQFEEWKTKPFPKPFSELQFSAFHFFDVKEGKVYYYIIKDYAQNSDIFIFSISGKYNLDK